MERRVSFFPFLLQLSRSVFPSPSLSFERCQSCFWWHACGQEWQNETKEERSLVSKWRLILARGYMCAVRRREMRYRSAVIHRPCEKDAGSLRIRASNTKVAGLVLARGNLRTRVTKITIRLYWRCGLERGTVRQVSRRELQHCTFEVFLIWPTSFRLWSALLMSKDFNRVC